MATKRPARITDRERLDWLNKNGDCLTKGLIWGWRIYSKRGALRTGKTPRQAIDAAIRSERSKKHAK